MASPREVRMSRNAVVMGAVVLVLAGFVLYLAATAHTGAPWSSQTVVKAAFHDVDSLNAGDEVRQNSVRIGRVRDVEYDSGQAVVTLELDGKRAVYRDASAAVWDYTALGTKFVELDPGTPGTGALGDEVIAASKNVDSADLYKVLESFDERTREAGGRAVRELGGGMAGHGKDLHDFLGAAPDTLHDLGAVSQALASDEADLPGMLRAADDLTARFRGRDRQVAELMDQANATFESFAVDNGKPLQDTVRRLPGTLDSARTAFDSLDRPLADTEAALAGLRSGARALGTAEPELRGFLREAVPPLRRLPGVARQAEPAVDDLTHMFTDARPLAPSVAHALGSAVVPMRILAPYAPEAGQLFVRGHSFLAAGAALPGLHYARLGVVVGPGSATGTLVEGDGLERNPYPAPGEASNEDRTQSPLGGGR